MMPCDCERWYIDGADARSEGLSHFIARFKTACPCCDCSGRVSIVRHFGKPRFTQKLPAPAPSENLLKRTFPSKLLFFTRCYFGTSVTCHSPIKRRRTLVETFPSTSTFHQGVPSQQHDRHDHQRTRQRQWRASQQASRACHQTCRQTALTPTNTLECARRLESLPRLERSGLWL